MIIAWIGVLIVMVLGQGIIWGMWLWDKFLLLCIVVCPIWILVLMVQHLLK